MRYVLIQFSWVTISRSSKPFTWFSQYEHDQASKPANITSAVNVLTHGWSLPDCQFVLAACTGQHDLSDEQIWHQMSQVSSFYFPLALSLPQNWYGSQIDIYTCFYMTVMMFSGSAWCNLEISICIHILNVLTILKQNQPILATVN